MFYQSKKHLVNMFTLIKHGCHLSSNLADFIRTKQLGFVISKDICFCSAEARKNRGFSYHTGLTQNVETRIISPELNTARGAEMLRWSA